MKAEPITAGSTESGGNLRSSAILSKAGLRGLTVGVSKLDRLGATVCLEAEELRGSTVDVGDAIELDIQLPENKSFRPRTLNAIGSVIGARKGFPGRLWVVIRFHSLQFRDADQERRGEEAASCRGGKSRGDQLAGRDWAEASLAQKDVK